MTKNQFKDAAMAKGWKPDAYGHLKHTSASGKEYRLKLQKLAWRLEWKHRPQPSTLSPGYAPPAQWVKLRSCYYGKTTEDRNAHAADATLRLVPVLPEPKPKQL